MKLVKWLQKFAESYNGTGDIDRFSVADGSMIRDDEASNYNTDGRIQFDSDGMSTPDFGKLNHPQSPNGENSLMTEDGPAWRDKQHLNSPNKQNNKDTDDSDMYSEKEIPQSEVGDNQADGTVPGTGIATASVKDFQPATSKELSKLVKDPIFVNPTKTEFGKADKLPHLHPNKPIMDPNGNSMKIENPNAPTLEQEYKSHGQSVKRIHQPNEDSAWITKPLTDVKKNKLISENGFLELFKKKADLDNDFFLQDSISGGCADSPQTMHDGHPIEELENYQQGINYVSNTDAPHADTPAGDMILHDHSLVDKKKNEVENIPEVFKGREPTSASLLDLFKSAYDSHQTIKDDGPIGGGSNQDGNQLLTDDEYNVLLDGKGSNVADIMYPFEVNQKHNRSTHDFGTGDTSGDERTMSDKPAAGYSGCSEETDNYSGINPTSFLKMFNKKPCGKCGRTDYNDIRCALCDLCLKKQADYTGVPPSVNPNSGKDSDDEDSSNTITDLERPSMIDGKQVTENFADKEMDPTVMRKKIPYPNRVEDDDATHYYDTINSGGGFGMGGGNDMQSGVDNSN